MTTKSKKWKIARSASTWIAIAVVILIGFAALVVHNYNTRTSFKNSSSQESSEQSAPENILEQNPQDPTSAAATKNNDPIKEIRENSSILKVSPNDFVIGDRAAPLVMFEYASLSCPHCSAFYRETFEKLKEEYIDTSKVLFIFRHFPLDRPALVAAMFATCQAQDNKSDSTKFYSTLKSLFKAQDSWAFDSKFDQKLEGIARLDGMSSERFTQCIQNQDLQDKILTTRVDAAKTLQIKSVPTFFINGESLEGYIDYLTIKKFIDSKLVEAGEKQGE